MDGVRKLGKWMAGCLPAAVLLAGCVSPHKQPPPPPPARNYFIGLTDFSKFTRSPDTNAGETAWLSPWFKSSNAWKELVVSWNARPGTDLEIQACAIFTNHATRAYSMGFWSDDPTRFPRQSVKDQADADGDVRTDTLVLKERGARVQLRITFAGTNGNASPALKFLGLSFCDTTAAPVAGTTNHPDWGKTLDLPERIQSGYDGPGGWCSPASLSMVLAYWSRVLDRPDLDRPVPDVAAAVNDPVYGGTGNWTFNTAYAGELRAMRAYVARLDDISELEDWIAAGVPVVMSVSSYLTNDRQSGPDNGHLIVCLGFTETGDVVANDPGVSLRNGQTVRQVYPRARVVEAWKKSKNTVYLVYPLTPVVPVNRWHHWEDAR